MGDRWERRNPLVDQAVDVDGAVVPAPPPVEPEALPETTDTERDDAPAVDLDADLPDADDLPDEDDEDDDLEEPDGRFARRKPRIDRALGDDPR